MTFNPARALPVITAGVLVLSGCGEPRLDQGRIIGKHYEPASTTTVFIPTQTGSICTGGQYPSCTPIFTPHPFLEYDDADWVLRLRDCPKPGECREGNAYVDQATYSEAHAGQWFDTTGDPQLMRDEPKRHRK